MLQNVTLSAYKDGKQIVNTHFDPRKQDFESTSRYAIDY